MLHENYSVDRIHELTKIDKWFLYKLQNIVDCTHELEDVGSLFGLNKELVMKAKNMGFSDRQIANAVGATEDVVRARRKNFGITPFVKKSKSIHFQTFKITLTTLWLIPLLQNSLQTLSKSLLLSSLFVV